MGMEISHPYQSTRGMGLIPTMHLVLHLVWEWAVERSSFHSENPTTLPLTVPVPVYCSTSSLTLHRRKLVLTCRTGKGCDLMLYTAVVCEMYMYMYTVCVCAG